jgi:hypothetical protein
MALSPSPSSPTELLTPPQVLGSPQGLVHQWPAGKATAGSLTPLFLPASLGRAQEPCVHM